MWIFTRLTQLLKCKWLLLATGSYPHTQEKERGGGDEILQKARGGIDGIDEASKNF